MSDSDAASLQGVEDALERLNLSIRGYNKGKREDAGQERDLDSTSGSEELHSVCQAHAASIKWSPGPSLFSRVEDSEVDDDVYPHIKNVELRKRLNVLHKLSSFISEHPYSIDLYSRIGSAYVDAGYPDLAAGAAYKALLLIDQLDDEDAEFYEPTFLSLAETVSKETLISRCGILEKYSDLQKSLFHPDHAEKDEEGQAVFPVSASEVQVWAKEKFARKVYVMLAECLHIIGCQRSAAGYCFRGLEMFPDHESLQKTLDSIYASVRDHVMEDGGEDPTKSTTKPKFEQFPDQGMVRREMYPWNSFEPDRCSDESVAFLNEELNKVAPKLEVKATELPALTALGGTSRQLGVFAKEDIAPGEIVLSETSLLTANNRLQDALCDACSTDLPEMTEPAFANVVDCPECSVVFCDQRCFDLADEEYHPAICDRGVEDIAKNAPRTEAANTLYTLLLLRALAMAETQDCHPLDLRYVKYIWGDYHAMDLSDHWVSTEDPYALCSQLLYPRTLPFSFQTNVVLPFNILEMMDIDVFQSPQYDVWVFNTLYAKFRGTASARLSGLSGRPIRGPEVSAVHPNWCLANHSCDPNVAWNWASEIKFRVLDERVQWQVAADANDGRLKRSQPGLRKGDEVLSHYCDIELPVKERREWAAGSLGGACACDRCVAEAAQAA